MNYYNDFDKGAAAWLRELIKAGLIPNGYVDERSITEVKPADLAGFTQCHFFCGIGGWPLALQLAGVPATQPLWTGSPPCQPFSVAGKQLAQDDPRHLAPAFLELIAQCRPQLLFGEQVAAAIGKHWLDALLIELEEQGYSCGAAVLPACSIGAPHKRDRLFFGAKILANSRRDNSPGEVEISSDERQEAYGSANQFGGCSLSSGSMANADDARPQGRSGMPERGIKLPAGPRGVASGLADAGSECERQDRMSGKGDGCVLARREETPAAHTGLCGDRRSDTHHGFWSDADWIGCRDGKFRPVEPGTFPLAHGVPARVGRLRGYGNAIVPPVAAEFIKAFTRSCENAGDNKGARDDS